MAKFYLGSIDLNKIDKSKIVSTDKNGQPFQNGAKYLNVVVWVNDEIDQYGNIASIQIGQSKEERESGQKATYIGNLKNVQGQNTNETSSNADREVSEEEFDNNMEEIDDDLPF